MNIQITPQTSLEPLSLAHTEALYALTEANRHYLKVWLPWLDHIESSADTENFIREAMEELSHGGAPNFAILFAGDICGVAGFHKIHAPSNSVSIGYWLAEDFTGRGIVTCAVRELLKIGFKEFRLNKIEVRCAEHNRQSRAIPERLGFTYEATLRECEWLYTKYVNHAVYSMLASEFDS
ncbi:MAG: GNAT family protein [Congregibacter sp.]